MTPAPTPAATPQRKQSIRAPVLWGLAFGAMQAALPLALWWLDQATVQALLLAMIAGVYIGFAVADGRPRVIALESSITIAFDHAKKLQRHSAAELEGADVARRGRGGYEDRDDRCHHRRANEL
jgi:hypothetical protein